MKSKYKFIKLSSRYRFFVYNYIFTFRINLEDIVLLKVTDSIDESIHAEYEILRSDFDLYSIDYTIDVILTYIKENEDYFNLNDINFNKKLRI